METLILLYFAYAVYRAGLDAAVRGYALARGKDVYIGEGDRRRHYAGWTLGAATAVFFRSLWEGWRVAWPWARTKADAARARRAARRDGGDLDDGWDDQPADTADDAEDEDIDGGEDDEPTRCARCGRDLSDTTIAISVRLMPEGWVCGEHFPDVCAACGNPARPHDPLVLDVDRAWIHRSHLHTFPTSDDPTAPEPPSPAGGEAAEVVDSATGDPVDAVWEDVPATGALPAAGWAKVHPSTP